MPLTHFLRWVTAMALGASLLLALPAWGAQHDLDPTSSPEASEASGVAEAKALIDAGRFMDAVAILGPLVQEDVIEANTLFLYGLAAIGASQQAGVPEDTREALLDQAIASFHAMLVEAPGLMRVRLELARAFFLKGEDDLARRHFQYVLAGDPPEAVVANVGRFLGEIEGRGRWSYRIGAALAPDSNIGGTSDERTIYIFNLPFERDVDELTTSGIGVSVWGGAEYQKPLGERVRLRAGAEFARREYERSQFDQLFVGTHLGPRWTIDDDTALSVLASARQRWLGTAPDNRELGGRLELNRRLSQSVTLSASAAWHGRRYRSEDRDHLGRAGVRFLAARRLGGAADRAPGSLRRLWLGAPGLGALAHPNPLGWPRGLGDSAAGLQRRRRRGDPVDGLPRERGQLVPQHR